MYSQEIENIALGHNIGVHVYANDIQCYFRFDENTLLDAKNARITDFMSDLKAWMNSNYLQLNELKTQLKYYLQEETLPR